MKDPLKEIVSEKKAWWNPQISWWRQIKEQFLELHSKGTNNNKYIFGEMRLNELRIRKKDGIKPLRHNSLCNFRPHNSLTSFSVI